MYLNTSFSLSFPLFQTITLSSLNSTCSIFLALIFLSKVISVCPESKSCISFFVESLAINFPSFIMATLLHNSFLCHNTQPDKLKHLLFLNKDQNYILVVQGLLIFLLLCNLF